MRAVLFQPFTLSRNTWLAMIAPLENPLSYGRQQIESVLEDVFGSRFDVVAEKAEANFGRDTVEITQLEPTSFAVSLHNLSWHGDLFAATGHVESLNKEAVNRSALSAVKLLERQQSVEEANDQLQYFMQQITGDLEEACWFRTMADEVAACRADDPFSSLCDRILPKLRTLLHARSAAIIMEEPDGTESRIVGMDADAEDSDELAEAALQVTRTFGEKASDHSFVWNRYFENVTESEQLPSADVNEFILVRIRTDRRHFGWLVAVNRLDPVGAEAQSRTSETEFGTHEATLMETAAVLLATHAANTDLFEEQERTLVGVVTAMVNALDARDPYTRGHSHRVALVSRLISRKVGLNDDDAEDIYLSGLLHDVGKIGVADHVLLKNGPLDPEERQQIERHTVIGHAILSPVRQLHHVLPGVLHHHEQIDGSGYPSGLQGENIPLAGRILAVADAYDAMTTSRPYRKAMPIEKAEAILLEGAGSHWDETIIDAFFQLKAEIEKIYDDQLTIEESPVASALQLGRFEDASQGTVIPLCHVGEPE